jgi:hypothetical protein
MAEKQNPKSVLRSAAKKFLTLAVVVAAFFVAWSFGRYQQSHRLDKFAHCLSDKNAVVYGLFWCPHCKEQEESFQSAFQFVHYEECGTPEHTEQKRCNDLGLKFFPTWQFADGDRHEGLMPLADLSKKTGCALK